MTKYDDPGESYDLQNNFRYSKNKISILRVF